MRRTRAVPVPALGPGGEIQRPGRLVGADLRRRRDVELEPVAIQLAGLASGIVVAGSLGWWIARRPRRNSA